MRKSIRGRTNLRYDPDGLGIFDMIRHHKIERIHDEPILQPTRESGCCIGLSLRGAGSAYGLFLDHRSRLVRQNGFIIYHLWSSSTAFLLYRNTSLLTI